MYDDALAIAKTKIRGGETEPFFKKPFIDAAFSSHIFLWDTCFLCSFAKYHLDTLPAYQALDNFYQLIEEDGYICREYDAYGKAIWPKTHPVSINPPLLAFAERDLFSQSKDIARIKQVYPLLKKNFYFHVENWMDEKGLFIGDALGSGMDNIPRYPQDWTPTEGSGLSHDDMVAEVKKLNLNGDAWFEAFVKAYQSSKQGVWYKHSRMVDLSAQMALYAKDLAFFATLLGHSNDTKAYLQIQAKIKAAVNQYCWDDSTQCYFDLGEGKQIPRKHIGMYWTLLADLVPEEKIKGFVAHLKDPNMFNRTIPFASLSAGDNQYKGWGDYWLGGVWAPTAYMALRGLTNVGEHHLAKEVAQKLHVAVGEVYQATGTFWENYAPDLQHYGMPSKKDFCGWSALIPINVNKEYLA